MLRWCFGAQGVNREINKGFSFSNTWCHYIASSLGITKAIHVIEQFSPISVRECAHTRTYTHVAVSLSPTFILRPFIVVNVTTEDQLQRFCCEGGIWEGGMEVDRATRMCGDQLLVWGTEQIEDEGERLGFKKTILRRLCEGFST